MKNSKIEVLLQREQVLAFSCLAIVVVISWAYMLHMSWRMSETGEDITLACMIPWGPEDIAQVFIMWAIMMVAMMFPSAAPMILMFSIVNQREGETQRPVIPMGIFVLGYFLVWTSYSALATLAQWGLHGAALLSHHLVITSPLLGGILLVAAGI
ncbi:MAG: copper chaperone, partial [Thermodesulfobacteriota bacterium]